MGVLEQQEFWEFMAVFLGVLAIIGGFLGKLTTLAVQFLEARQVRIRRKNIKGLVLAPTLEELAMYSAPLPQRTADEELLTLSIEAHGIEHDKIMDGFRQDKLDHYNEMRMQGRLLVMALAFFCAFTAIGVRFALIQVGYF